MDLPIRCRCGALRGTLRFDPADARRLRCHCDDCRAWARHLGRDDVLDAHGGTSILQTSPARVSFTDGLEHLDCRQLAPGGLYRWYARCCDTPVGNTLGTPRAPFVGLVTACLPEREALDILPEAGVQGRFAPGGAAPGAHPSASVAIIWGSVRLMARWWWRGDAARSPFFDAAGAPARTPRVLTEEERDAAYGRS